MHIISVVLKEEQSKVALKIAKDLTNLLVE